MKQLRELSQTLAICLILLAPITASAETIDPEKVEAIRELMRITGAQANQEELTNTFTQQMTSVLQANNTALTPEAIEYIRQEVDEVVSAQLQQEKLQQRMYSIYARYFTLEELRGLIAFNQTDIGRKANRVMPLLMRESMGAAQAWSVEIGPEISKRVQRRLASEGIRIGQ